MSRVDLHPEALLDRARRGEATDDEFKRVREHLDGCAACRFEVALSRQLDREADELCDDERAVLRVRTGALRRLAARRGDRGAPGLPRRGRLFAAAAAACLVLAVGAAAALSGRLFALRAGEPSPAALPGSSARPGRPRAGLERTVPAAPVSAAPVPLSSRARDLGAEHSTSVRLAPDELFARANAARRGGDAREAARLYRELQRAFPASSQALLSRLTLGRLLLDRLGDPKGALVEFDLYLASAGRGSLREEALVGRALALAGLGRGAEERAAWAALLEQHPKSTYAEHARGRIAALGGGAAAPR